MTAAAAVEFGMGRRAWGVSGIPGFWSGDIWSSHNSQFLFDPYTFTHITHGFLFYGALALLFRNSPILTRLIVTVALEGGWEILENTNMIIERYRAETVSLNYFGDSIVNSMGDIVACMFGFFLASRLPARISLLIVVAFEIVLLLWTRDNLTLNIIMLLHPSAAIKAWQIGH
jgi:hypothetical protein